MNKILSSDDFFKLKFVGDPQIDPSGTRVLFTVSHANDKKDGYDKSIYMYDGRKYFQFTSGSSDSNPRWSPNGEEIAFASSLKDEKGMNLMIISRDGGEARRIAHFDDHISELKWSDDNSLILSISIKQKRKDPHSDVHEISKIPFWFNGEGFIYDNLTQLFLVQKNGKKQKLTDERGQISSYSVSPDGKNIAFVESLDLEHSPLVSDLFVLKMGWGSPKKLTDSKKSIGNLTWDQDSKRIALTLSDIEHGSFTNERIWITDLDGKFEKICDIDLPKANSVNSDSRGSSSNQLFWNKNGIYFMMTDGPSAKVFRVLNGKTEEMIGGERSVDGFSVSKNGNIAFISMDFSHLDDLFIFKNGKEKRLSRFSDTIIRNFKLSIPEHFDVIASDGQKIDAWIMKPVDFQHGKKYPTILEIHGGPRTAYGNAFFFEFQLLASNGFSVIFSNPRGSDGYGEKFSYIYGAYGKRDYKDLMEVVDESVKKFEFVDENRLGVTGGSYGGYMTNWIVTQTDRFKAAVSQRSISNWTSFFGTTDIGYFFGPDQLGGDPWSNSKGYTEMSPLTHVKNVKTPIMFIHSMEDYRCYMVEAFQFFTALRYFGKEAKLALFPSESHELSRSGKPYHRVKRLNLILDWFKSHLVQ